MGDEVTNCFQLEPDGWLTQLVGSPPEIKTPLDLIGIAPGPGDDTSPVNATKMNGVAAYALANVGFSSAVNRERVFPTSYDYELRVATESGAGQYGLEVKLTLEYRNPHPGEGMIVAMKKIKQLCAEPDGIDAMADAAASSLVLVDTSFMDWADDGSGWVNISTDIRYTATAEAVAEAVMTSGLDQTAGILKQNGAVETARLGPVGPKGRVVLTYRCEALES
eukprot:g3015.t1